MTRYGVTEMVRFAGELTSAWRSHVVAQIGSARLKLLRMDAGAYEQEQHEYDEALLVVDGVMELDVAGERVSVRGGELYVVPAGVPHAVAPGSRGTLMIIDV